MSGRAGALAAPLVRPIRVGIDCRPFQIPRCANLDCRAPLCDDKGEPRWDLLEERFVCLGRCVGGGSRG